MVAWSLSRFETLSKSKATLTNCEVVKSDKTAADGLSEQVSPERSIFKKRPRTGVMRGGDQTRNPL
jgi:hypothetical protein